MNVDGRLKSDVTWQFKAQLVYKLPAGFLVSANFSSRDGAHLVRRTRALKDITLVPENKPILLQPRGENGRLSDVTLLDMRLQKDFRLGGSARLSVFADALNLLEREHNSGGRDLARGGLDLPVSEAAAHSAPPHAGSEGQVLGLTPRGCGGRGAPPACPGRLPPDWAAAPESG